MTAIAPDEGTSGSGAGYMLDAGMSTGGAGDLPGIFGIATYAGWQRGGLEPRGVCSSAQGGLIAMCTAISPQHFPEAVAVQCHHTAVEGVGNWVGQGGVESHHCWVKYDNQLAVATRSIPGDASRWTMAGSGWHL
jgi:hypothetical protein